MANVSDASDEVLERIWTRLENAQGELTQVHALRLEEMGLSAYDLADLASTGCVTISADGATFLLTDAGREAARDIVRRHRLAERLLADVLDVGGSQLDESACQFEHVLHADINEKVCILLGHPRTCPHGKAIPPGACCGEGRDRGAAGGKGRIVSALTDMHPGERGTITYLHAPQGNLLRKLLALGILPGKTVELRRAFPSYVFRVNETEYAVDKDIAAAVYVRLTD